MNLLEKSIKCTFCEEIIIQPVFLPCGHSICKHHVDETVEENEKQIKCDICDKSFDIPINGFAPNIALESLMEVDIDELDMGEEYNSAFNKCDQFEDLLEYFNNAKNDPETRIHSVLNDLRNKVDLRREELKQEIDKKALEMIEKIDEYEKNCKASIKSDSSLDNKIGEWKDELVESQLVLNTIKKNTEKWNEISNKMTSNLKDFQSEFIKFNENLFLNRLHEFMYSDLNLTNNDFHEFSVEVKELSRSKGIKENKKLAYHVFEAFGIQWLLRVYVDFKPQNTKPRDQFITIFLGYDVSNTQIHDINVDFDLVILDQLNMDVSIKKNICENFDSLEGWGSHFTTLNDLLENYNLYNVEKDSFMVQVVIKKVKWL